MEFEYRHYQEAADYIRSQTSLDVTHGIILGTGLGQLVDDIDIICTIDYPSIPHFPVSTVETHAGKLIFGTLAGKNVVVMQGRFHFYEGYSMQQVTFPVRVMKLLGIDTILISNISGGINHQYEEGDLMVIEDHINLLPDNPLRGKNMDEFGLRFPDMLHTYNPELMERAYLFGKTEGYRIHKGVYSSVMGPNLETPAEYKYLSIIGADAVGMSTVPEVIVAQHAGLKIFALSLISDLGVPGKIAPADINKIIANANAGQPKMTAIFKHLLEA